MQILYASSFKKISTFYWFWNQKYKSMIFNLKASACILSYYIQTIPVSAIFTYGKPQLPEELSPWTSCISTFLSDELNKNALAAFEILFFNCTKSSFQYFWSSDYQFLRIPNFHALDLMSPEYFFHSWCRCVIGIIFPAK